MTLKNKEKYRKDMSLICIEDGVYRRFPNNSEDGFKLYKTYGLDKLETVIQIKVSANT